MEELCALGTDPKYVCVSKSNWRSAAAGGPSADGVVSNAASQPANNSGETSDEDEDEDSDSRQAMDIGEGSPVRFVSKFFNF